MYVTVVLLLIIYGCAICCPPPTHDTRRRWRHYAYTTDTATNDSFAQPNVSRRGSVDSTWMLPPQVVEDSHLYSGLRLTHHQSIISLFTNRTSNPVIFSNNWWEPVSMNSITIILLQILIYLKLMNRLESGWQCPVCPTFFFNLINSPLYELMGFIFIRNVHWTMIDYHVFLVQCYIDWHKFATKSFNEISSQRSWTSLKGCVI